MRGACALFLVLCLTSCAAAVPRDGAARGAQVRLDAVARALARARVQQEQGCPPRRCDRTRPAQQTLERALVHAELTLEQTQHAADRWLTGDGRRFGRLRPRLARALRRVASALQAARRPVPPGLCELFPLEIR